MTLPGFHSSVHSLNYYLQESLFPLQLLFGQLASGNPRRLVAFLFVFKPTSLDSISCRAPVLS